MAYLNTIGCGEGLSSSRPPLFDGTNFATWKTRFRIYARSQGVKVWMAIEDGIIIPTKIIDDVIYEKKVSEYTHDEEDRMNIAAKAEMVLTSALAEKEYKRVNNCKSAQEMWNKLVVTYEGTTDIKDSRMDTLIMEYENFKLQEGENIIDMETRFTRIVDELAQLGKNYTQNEKNRRVLKSLPPSWKVKVTTIKEMHNLNDYHIDNLFGNLRAYEEDNVPDVVVPKVEEKKKNMALKAILIDDDDNDEELNEELKNLDESEIALLTRQLRRVLQSKAQRYGKGFLKSNNQQRVFNSNGRPNYSQNYTPNYKSNFPPSGYNKGKGIQNSNSNSYNNANNNNINNNNYTSPKPKEPVQEDTQDVCFECKQPGHYKRECPKLAKGRVLVAENGWDLSEDEEASEASEEIVNLCLMASDNASTSSDDSTTNQEVSGPSRVLENMHLFIDSSLNLLDMSKSDLIDLLVHINSRYCDTNQRFLATWSEHEKLKDSSKDQQKELTRMMESMIEKEDDMKSLNDQNDSLKLEINKYKDNITNLEIENVSLLLQAEELENEKIQLNENNCKLHVDVLNLKIQNESLTQEK
nr:PREDICTED: putative histone-lysine N-methyltransferase 1 [Daucus carota subsp. sativus]